MSDEPKVDTDAWMGTLSDLVFLLITFFVLLISEVLSFFVMYPA